jgi:iron complex outermembrane receptor protein
MSIFSVTVHEIIYGPSSEWDSDDGDNTAATPIYYETRIGTIPITNVEFGVMALKDLRIAIGANNVFNRYPEQINPNVTAHEDAYDDNGAVAKYPSFSPIGIDGGFYYVRGSFRF